MARILATETGDPNGVEKPVAKQNSQILLPISFRGISFPVMNLNTSFDQDVARHKYINRDGSFIESIGRSSIKVSCTAIFSNYIEPAAGETWKYGNLMPDVFSQMFQAFADRTKGELIHPYLGKLDVKPLSWGDSFSPDNQGGCSVDLSFEETITPEITSENQTHLDAISGVTQDLQSQLEFMSPTILKQSNLNTFDLFDAMDRISGFIDQGSLFIKQNLALIDRTIQHVNRFKEAVQRLNDVKNAALLTNLNRVSNALQSAKQAVNNKEQGKLTQYITKEDCISSDLVQILGNTIIDLIKLNPKVMILPVIPANTVINYYRFAPTSGALLTKPVKISIS